MSLVFDVPRSTPCAHALVIGVGDYPNAGWGVGPIDSAALSALEFSAWLGRSFAGNTTWPLSTVDLLVSGAAGHTPASTANIFSGIQRWFARCRQHEDNLAIFYFAGHGVEKGLVTSLLSQDFGANQLDIGDDALNLNLFAAGMERCLARKQWFVIDACRNTPPQLVANLSQFGRPGIAPDADDHPSQVARDHVILRAASAAGQAYGRAGEPSRFTRALIKALDGAAWDDDNQPWSSWTVRIERLVTAVNHLLDVEEQLHHAPPQRARLGGDSGGFVLWQPSQPPTVPVYVTCAPSHRMQHASLMVQWGGGHQRQRAAGNPDAWEVGLQAAQTPYVISASFPQAAQPVQSQVIVRPPSRKMEIAAP